MIMILLIAIKGVWDMLELVVLALFSAGLLMCVIFGYSILYALIGGYILFFSFGLMRKKTVKQMLHFSFLGMLTVKNILIVFVFIGIITAVWRASGTIAFIVYYSSSVCTPRIMLVVTFLLCCLVSTLLGTAFGSAATIGIICMTLANSMGIPVIYTGGAIISGIFFGDRCSPMSTSALLISELTQTDIFKNIKIMIKTALVPLLLTIALYTVIGFMLKPAADYDAAFRIFSDYYNLSVFTVIPALIIIVFSLFKISVKITLAVSSLAGIVCALLLQHIPGVELVKILVFGFKPENAELAKIMSGGGILSMAKVFCIIGISACYSGIFKGTNFLDGIQSLLVKACVHITPFGGILLTSLLASGIACNQSLAIMLTHQLCNTVVPDKYTFASHLENTAVVVAPMIPWSIAITTPLTSIEAPLFSLYFAFYLYLIPLWNFAVQLFKGRKTT